MNNNAKVYKAYDAVNAKNDSYKQTIQIVDEIKHAADSVYEIMAQKAINSFPNNGYWGVGESDVAELIISNNNYSTDLIPVNEGDIIELLDWSKNDVLSSILFSCYNLDRKPYNGSEFRINGSSKSVVTYENGYVKFIVPNNCNLIGVRIKTNTGQGDNPRVIIGSKNVIHFTENAKKEINNSIDYSRIKTDRYSELYLKGAAIKGFNSEKKLGIICAGQSNADGRSPITDLNTAVTFPIKNLHFSKNKINGSFASYNRPSTFAFDMLTYNQICNIDGIEVYAIKWSVGGTSISANTAKTSVCVYSGEADPSFW